MSASRRGPWWWALVVTMTTVASWAQPAVPAASRAFAALSGDYALLVVGGKLYRADRGAWHEVPVSGAVPRDVTAARGALWIAAEGTGTQAGIALVLRANATGELVLAGSVPLPAGFTVRSMAVAGATDWVIGGEGGIVRMRNGVTTTVPVAGSPVASLRYMPDEILAVRHVDGTLTTWRWGDTRDVARTHASNLIAGIRGTLVLRTDGAVELGPPWVPTVVAGRPWLPPSGIEPVSAVVMPGEQAVEVSSDGHGERWAGGPWQPLDITPGPPWALATTPQGAMVVLADGTVCALVGTRWQVRVAALPESTR